MIFWLSIPIPVPTLGMVAWWLVCSSVGFALLSLSCVIHDIKHDSVRHRFTAYGKRNWYAPSLFSHRGWKAKEFAISISLGPVILAFGAFMLWMASRESETQIENREWARRKRLIDDITGGRA